MVNGAWLDFYCIGPLQRQEDRTGLDLASGIYQFHARNERWLNNTRPGGEIAVVRRGGEELEGLVQILSENHVAFELLRLSAEPLERYAAVIVPAAGGLNDNEVRQLDAYVSGGGKLLTTGQLPNGIECLAAAEPTGTKAWPQGAYVRIRPADRERLGQALLRQLDLVFLRGEFHQYELKGKIEGLLRFIPTDMFGPPEKCYYRKVSDFPGLVCAQSGRGAVAGFTFDLGRHYFEQGHQGHAALLIGALDKLLDVHRRVQVSASPLVEINHRKDKAEKFEWVSLYNHSGQRGHILHAPVPIHDVRIRFAAQRPVAYAMLLASGDRLPANENSDGSLEVRVPRLDNYDIVVFVYE
jgi:hypothetical protein